MKFDTLEADRVETGCLSAGRVTGISPTVVANLSVNPHLGDEALVTDGDSGLAWGATVVNSGMGATNYKVWWNGSAWKVFAK